MRRGTETIYIQTTFIFTKEQHGTIPSMHLTKFRKSENCKKNKKLKLVNENYIYSS